MIDPSIWTDEGMAELTPRQQLLYIGMISNADDDGRLKGSESALRLTLPTLYAGAAVAEIAGDVDAVLATMRQVVRYQCASRVYIAFRNYRQWQKIDKPSPSILPPPPEMTDDSTSPHRTLVEPSPNAPVAFDPNRIEENRSKEKRTTPPTPQAPPAPVEVPPPSAADPPAPVPLLSRAAPKPTKGPPPQLVALFERQFWPAWPKRVGRAEALTAFVKLRPTEEDVGRMVAAIPEQAEALDWPRENYRYCPNPATWLNQRRWEDEPPQPGPSSSHQGYLGNNTSRISDATIAWMKQTRSAD
jgi:hypothetical protein